MNQRQGHIKLDFNHMTLIYWTGKKTKTNNFIYHNIVVAKNLVLN